MQKIVKIYSPPTCHFCNMAKEFFAENNIKYEALDVSTDVVARNEMVEQSGQLGVPVIIIGDDLIVGFNKPKVAELLDITL